MIAIYTRSLGLTSWETSFKLMYFSAFISKLARRHFKEY